MRKFLLLMALAVGVTFCVKAQDKKVTWGVRAGMNISTFGDKFDGSVEDGESKSDYETDFKSRVGFHIGAIMDWSLSEKFYIQPGLYFTTRGAKVEDNSEGEKYEVKYNLNYL